MSVYLSLLYRAEWVKGWADALNQALFETEVLENNQRKINLTLKSEAELITSWQLIDGELSQHRTDDTSDRSKVYQQGYLAGTQYIIELIKCAAKEGITPIQRPGTLSLYQTPEQIVWYDNLIGGGRTDALFFAAKQCQGNAACVEARIQETEKTIAQAMASMSPGASPRIYQEGYLSGLKEAFEIIIKVQQGEKLPQVSEEV